MALSLDFGSAYCNAGVFKHNDVESIEVVANDQGNNQTPCYIAFTGESSPLPARRSLLLPLARCRRRCVKKTLPRRNAVAAFTSRPLPSHPLNRIAHIRTPSPARRE
jgi:hypothetical protein